MAQGTIRLDEVVRQVHRAHPDGDPLDLVEEAVTVAGGLTEVADHLIGHFVDNARGSGLSWTQIGGRLGVSKQAVRKRFAPDDALLKERVFGRYTAAARHVVVLAQDSAVRHRHPRIGTEHLLLGLCAEPGDLGVRALAAAGADADIVRRAVTARLPEPDGEPTERPPFSADAKKALELTLRAALRLVHDHVGTEHLLLGLCAQRVGLAGRVLADLGVDEDAVRAAVDRLTGR